MMWRLTVILAISQICLGGWGQTDVLEPLRILDCGESILDAALSPDGTLVLTGGADGSAKLWNAGTGELLRTFVCHERGVACTVFSPDGRRVLTGGHDCIAKLWEAETGEFIRALEGHDGTITSAAFSPDGALILTGASDGAVKLWWGDSGNLLHTFAGHEESVDAVSFTADGMRILTGSLDGAVRMWDARSLALIDSFQVDEDGVWTLTFSPEGAQVLAGVGDAAVLSNTITGGSARTFEGHGSSVTSAAFQADGSSILTGSSDATAKLWDLALGRERLTLYGHASEVTVVAFSPDGGLVLTASMDGTARVWDIKEFRYPAVATPTHTATVTPTPTDTPTPTNTPTPTDAPYRDFRTITIPLWPTGEKPEGAKKLEMILVPAGTYKMGSRSSTEIDADEIPRHVVTISRPFYLGKYEITQAQWEAVMGYLPAVDSGGGKGDNYPAYNIDWKHCQRFAEALTSMGHGIFRLPTEAEWEYACKAETETRYYWGNDPSTTAIDAYAWHPQNADRSSHPVGLKRANRWGFHDMSGNVWEWCLDPYGPYARWPQLDPQGPAGNYYRAIRGGSWNPEESLLDCRSSNRECKSPGYNRGYHNGARIVREFFGDAPALRITVKPTPTCTPTMTPTSTLTPTMTATPTPSSTPVPTVHYRSVLIPLPGMPECARPLEMVSLPAESTAGNVEAPFYLSKYETTQAQWAAVMGALPEFEAGFTGGPDHPIHSISWNQVQTFLSLLNEMECGQFRLPTSGEWEFACRAGSLTNYSFGDGVKGWSWYDDGLLDKYIWWSGNASWSSGMRGARETGLKAPNPWGLYDMHGNVWEMSSTLRDASHIYVHGGGWDSSRWQVMSDSREYRGFGYPNYSHGFRLLMTDDSPSPTPTETAATPTPAESPSASPASTPRPTPSPNTASAYFQLGSASVRQGESGCIPVYASGFENVRLVCFDIVYDPSKLNCSVCFSEGDRLPQLGRISTRIIEPGHLEVCAPWEQSSLSALSAPMERALLFHIRFTGIGGGGSAITLGNFQRDFSGAAAAPGSVYVEPPPTPTMTPIGDWTAIKVDPFLGIVGMTRSGGQYLGGASVFNFDIGVTEEDGSLTQEYDEDGVLIRDYIADPAALAPVPDGEMVRDIEFSGEVNALNGSQGVYVLWSGNGNGLPPVHPSLGANPEGGGGIDVDNNPSNDIDFGGADGDFIESGWLVDIEGAGNDGFYVLDFTGRIFGEGDINPDIESLFHLVRPEPFFNNPAENYIATDLEIFRGFDIASPDINGLGAWMLSSRGRIVTLGDAPVPDTSEIPVSMFPGDVIYRDMELIPNADGTKWIGLGIMDMIGRIRFAPFLETEETIDLETIVPDFGTGRWRGNIGLGYDVARDFEVVISDTPIMTYEAEGMPVTPEGRRIGTFILDGYGGIHTGGAFIRNVPIFVPPETPGGIPFIEGVWFISTPINIPYFDRDRYVDAEVPGLSR